MQRLPRRGLLVVFALLGAGRLRAQADTTGQAALNVALDLEGANRCRDAVRFFRRAMVLEDPTGAVLGLERCYHELGRPDSLASMVDTLLKDRPLDVTLRAVQLRALSTMRADSALQQAFERWLIVDQRTSAPYRVFARILLDQGRPRGADTVLQRARSALSASQELAPELAQVQAALSLWPEAAASWRSAAEQFGYLEAAAIYSLGQSAVPLRDTVRAILRAPPVSLNVRRVLAGLELRWGSPREAWRALQEVAPSDSVVAAWEAFAIEAEGAQEWLTARDAFLMVARARRRDARWLFRGASAAMNGGDAEGALEVARTLNASRDTSLVRPALMLTVRALSVLGRANEIERLLRERAAMLDSADTRDGQRALAWAWIRVGDLVRARATLKAAGDPADGEDRIASWIALYEGDLVTARRSLRRTDETTLDMVTALAFLARTERPRSEAAGQGFLLLARRDSAAAAERFLAAATELPEAAPFLIGQAARLYALIGAAPKAVPLWERLIRDFATAPEAPEAELTWARLLRKRGEASAATERLEHLILTYPRSALVPQARRELDIIQGRVPPAN